MVGLGDTHHHTLLPIVYHKMVLVHPCQVTRWTFGFLLMVCKYNLPLLLPPGFQITICIMFHLIPSINLEVQHLLITIFTINILEHVIPILFHPTLSFDLEV